MLTRSRSLLCVVAFVFSTLLVAPAFAQDDTHVFDSDALHFVYGDSVLVTSTRVDAPEGPVDVVMVQPKDPETGVITGTSFLSFSIFRQPIASTDAELEGLDDAEVALRTIVDGVKHGFPDGTRVGDLDGSLNLGGEDLISDQFTVRLNQAQARVRAGATEQGDAIIVYYDQRTGRDADLFDDLNQIVETFGYGPAPEELLAEHSGDDEAAAAPEPTEADEE